MYNQSLFYIYAIQQRYGSWLIQCNIEDKFIYHASVGVWLIEGMVQTMAFTCEES